ncbi:Uncharacterised protein [Streptococcus pneumoniae]|nr:Uncharacterised protein [Streptococcus pneumoniae]
MGATAVFGPREEPRSDHLSSWIEDVADVSAPIRESGIGDDEALRMDDRLEVMRDVAVFILHRRELGEKVIHVVATPVEAIRDDDDATHRPLRAHGFCESRTQVLLLVHAELSPMLFDAVVVASPNIDDDRIVVGIRRRGDCRSWKEVLANEIFK